MDVEKKTLKVTEDHQNTRLDKVISDYLDDYSRMEIKALLKNGLVLVNGQIKKPSFLVRGGETIEISLEEKEEKVLTYQPLNVSILFEDDDLMVVEKPSGLITHPSPSTKEPSLLEGLLDRIDPKKFDIPSRAGVVHRLDKDTSGLLLFAKNEATLTALQASLQKREVKRYYQAICDGVIDHNRGKIDAPIGRHPKKRHMMSVVAGAKESVTFFNVLERFKENTLIECELKSGRTHQIRVHMQYIDKPILGDTTYGRRKQEAPHGQFLHAYKLTFTHPQTFETMAFESELPQFFKAKIETLRRESNG